MAAGLAVLATSLAPAAAAHASGIVSVSPQGAGTVSGTQPSGGAEIHCTRSPTDVLTGPCSATVHDVAGAPGAIVLRASAASGFAFVDWSGACSGTATTCRVSVPVGSVNRSVGARFVRCPLRRFPLGPVRSAFRPRC